MGIKTKIVNKTKAKEEKPARKAKDVKTVTQRKGKRKGAKTGNEGEEERKNKPKLDIRKLIEEEGGDDNNDDDNDDELDLNHASSEEDNAVGDDRMIRLAEQIDQTSSSGKAPRRKVIKGSTSKENAFEAAGSMKISLADLMGGEQTEHQGQLKKRLAKLQSSRTEEIAPALSKADQDRADRLVGYAQSVSKLDSWEPLVAANRKQKLSFPLNEASLRERPSIQNVLPKNNEGPRNDAEREIMEALQASGLASEKQVLEEEERELKQLGEEESKKRQGELAKMRALMFYSEQKAKRVKKIKSKTFRRLRKKRLSREEEQALEKLRESDLEVSFHADDKAFSDID